jgi:hypothetical protein
MNWIVRGSPQYNALMQQQQAEMTNSVNGLPQNSVQDLSWNPAFRYDALGFQGDGYSFSPEAAVQGGTGWQMTPELQAFLEQGGFNPAYTEGGTGAYSQSRMGIADASGNIVPGTEYNNPADTGSDLRDWILYSAALYGAGTGLESAMGGAGGGTAGGTAGMTASEQAAMMAANGMTDAEIAAALGSSGANSAGLAGVGGGAAATPTITTTMGGPTAGQTAGGGLMSGMTTSDWARLAQTGVGLYGQYKAADAMKDANSQQNALIREMWQANRQDNQPLLNLRNSVLPQIQGLISNPSSITSDPGYQFGLKQGQTQIDNSAAARGGYYSGQQMKASQQYGQDYAGSKLTDSLNRLMGVAGLGQVGATQNQSNNQSYATQGGNALMQQGNIRGSGYLAGAGTINQGIGDWYRDWADRKTFGG